MATAPQIFPPIGDLLRRLGIRLEKGKSQHFLRSQEVCSRIAELGGLSRRHLVIEVGAGLGNLSVELASRAGRVVSVELDRAFEEWHTYLRASYPALEIVYADFLRLRLEELVGRREDNAPVVGVGNLPYQITSEILFRFVDSPQTFERLVFMVQKEVADRIAAGPGNRAAGALTYKIALRYRAEVAFDVAPEEFLPPPKVNSSILVLTPLPRPLLTDPGRRDFVYTMLDRLFRYRRKTLVNGLLQGALVADRSIAMDSLARAGIEERRRPESLDIGEMLRLAEVLEENGNV